LSAKPVIFDPDAPLPPPAKKVADLVAVEGDRKRFDPGSLASPEPIKVSYVFLHENVQVKRPGGNGGDQDYGSDHFQSAKASHSAMGDRGEWEILLYPALGWLTIQHKHRPDVDPVLVHTSNVVYCRTERA